MKTVVLAGALDTKAAEFAWVKALIEKQGVGALVIDVGILGEPGFAPDVSREAVASAAGGDLDALRRGEGRGEALEVMGRGLAVVARALYDDGVVAVASLAWAAVAVRLSRQPVCGRFLSACPSCWSRPSPAAMCAPLSVRRTS